MAESEHEKKQHEGKLSKTVKNEVGRVDSPKRKHMPADVFLKPAERKYPVKTEQDGKWTYNHGLLLAAARDARMHGDEALAARADAIRGRVFGGTKKKKKAAAPKRTFGKRSWGQFGS